MSMWLIVQFMMVGGVNYMKKIFVLSALICFNVAYAEAEILSPYPEAKDGVNIWPMVKINPSYNNKVSLANEAFIETNETNDAVNFLLNIKKSAKQEISQYSRVTDDADTHLKSSISKLHLNFDFKGIPSISESAVIGYSVAGGYTANGWNGAVQFADMKDMGICSFTSLKIKKVILAKEKISYVVNGKPSEKIIAGNYTAGFLYDVNWYTKTRRYSLECANLKFDSKIIDKMVVVSKRIDGVNKD